MFVDSSGRRARGVRAAGVAVASLCAFWLLGLTVGMAGFSGFPTIGVRVLAHAGIARSAALEADARVDRSAIDLSPVAEAAARRRVADADGSVRALPCSAPRPALPVGPLQSAQRRPHRPGPSSAKSALGTTTRPACPGEVADASRRGVNTRLT